MGVSHGSLDAGLLPMLAGRGLDLGVEWLGGLWCLLGLRDWNPEFGVLEMLLMGKMGLALLADLTLSALWLLATGLMLVLWAVGLLLRGCLVRGCRHCPYTIPCCSPVVEEGVSEDEEEER